MAEDTPLGAVFAFETGLHSLDEQLRRIEALDAKAGVLLAADGVLAGFLFTRGSVLLQAPDWIGIVATASILVSIALALLGFATRDYVTAPKPEAVAQRAGATEAMAEVAVRPPISCEQSTRTAGSSNGKLGSSGCPFCRCLLAFLRWAHTWASPSSWIEDADVATDPKVEPKPRRAGGR